MDFTINVGLVGLGRAGQVHLKNLTQISGVNLVIVSDLNIATHAIARNAGVQEVTTDALEVINHPLVEAVVVACPTHLHFEYVMAIVQAGKHVYCEKPLDTNIAAINIIEAEVEKYNVKLMVGFNRRFDPNFHKVHQLRVAGEIGAPQLLKISSRDPDIPAYEFMKTSGGLFMDFTIHDFDMARFIVGKEILQVYVKGETLIDEKLKEWGDIDTAVILLTFENGVLGIIDNSRKAVYGYDQRLEIFGSKGMLVSENKTVDQVSLHNSQGILSALPMPAFLERYQDAFRNAMLAFIECIKQNQASPVSCLDSKIATAVAIAANLSYRENREVSIQEILEQLV